MNKHLRTYSLLAALLTTTVFTPTTLFAAGAPAGAGTGEGVGGDEDTGTLLAQRIFTYNALESTEFKNTVFFPFQRNFETFLETFRALGHDLIQLVAEPSGAPHDFNRGTPSVESVLDEYFGRTAAILSGHPSAARAWGTFNALYREKSAPLIETANALLTRAQALPIFTPTIYQGAPDPINFMWINPADDGAAQIALINDIEQFKKEVSRWKAENPVFDYSHHRPLYNFLAFYQNVDAILSTGKFMPLDDYAINLWKTFAEGGDLERASVEFSASLGARTIALYAPQKIVRGPDSYESTAGAAEVITITPSIVAPPRPRLISTFTREENEIFKEINTYIERILAAQKTGGRGLMGYGVAGESIMDYGMRIAPEYERPIRILLTEQLRRRGLILQSIDTIQVEGAESFWTETLQRKLFEWVESLDLGQNIEAVKEGIIYARGKLFSEPDHNKTLLQALWNLRMMDQKYREGSDSLRESWNVVLIQALNLIETHNGKCATGARGRAVLIQKQMVQFMMDNDSKLPVGR